MIDLSLRKKMNCTRSFSSQFQIELRSFDEACAKKNEMCKIYNLSNVIDWFEKFLRTLATAGSFIQLMSKVNLRYVILINYDERYLLVHIESVCVWGRKKSDIFLNDGLW